MGHEDRCFTGILNIDKNTILNRCQKVFTMEVMKVKQIRGREKKHEMEVGEGWNSGEIL